MTKVWVVSERGEKYDGPEITMYYFSSQELADKYTAANKTYDYNNMKLRRLFDVDTVTLDDESWLTKYV